MMVRCGGPCAEELLELGLVHFPAALPAIQVVLVVGNQGAAALLERHPLAPQMRTARVNELVNVVGLAPLNHLDAPSLLGHTLFLVAVILEPLLADGHLLLRQLDAALLDGLCALR